MFATPPKRQIYIWKSVAAKSALEPAEAAHFTMQMSGQLQKEIINSRLYQQFFE